MLEKFLSIKRAEIANKLIPHDHRKGRILDIGCGEHAYFLNVTEFSEKHGIDRAVNDGVFSNKDREKIFIKNCDVEKDSLRLFDDEYFNVVTMLAVFEHFEPKNLPRILREIKRVLKLDGILILTTPASHVGMILQILSKLKLVNPAFIEEHKALYSTKEIFSMLIKGGFSKEDIRSGNFELFMNTWVSVVKK